MELRTNYNAVNAWEAETKLKEQEVELMERLIARPDDRALQMELDVTSLEPEFQGKKTKDGQPITHVYASKGL